MYMNRNDSYEYESEELDEEKEEKRRKIIKGIFFSILVIVVVIIVLLLLKGCGKDEVNRYDDLVKAAKAYYAEDREIMSNFEYDALYDEWERYGHSQLCYYTMCR